MANLHVGSTNHYDNVYYMGSNLGLGPLCTILPLPSYTHTGSTFNGVDVYRARPRCVQFRIKRRKLLAVDHHVAFFLRERVAAPATHVPPLPPSIENEEHRLPEVVPLLVADEGRAGWYAYGYRGRIRLHGFGRFEDLLSVADRHTHPFEAATHGKSVVDVAAGSDRQRSRVRVSVCLGRSSIVPPGHLRDPGDVDEIGVDRGIQSLISADGIEKLAASFDASIAAPGLVDCVFIHVRLPRTDQVKLQRWQWTMAELTMVSD